MRLEVVSQAQAQAPPRLFGPNASRGSTGSVTKEKAAACRGPSLAQRGSTASISSNPMDHIPSDRVIGDTFM